MNRLTKTEFHDLAAQIINPTKKKLNLFGKGITHVKKLSPSQEKYYRNVQEIDLSHNALQSIENLAKLPIRILNLAHNKISDQNSLIRLLSTPNSIIGASLEYLYLKGNPFINQGLSKDLKKILLCIENDLGIFTQEELHFAKKILKWLKQLQKCQELLKILNQHSDWISHQVTKNPRFFSLSNNQQNTTVRQIADEKITHSQSFIILNHNVRKQLSALVPDSVLENQQKDQLLIVLAEASQTLQQKIQQAQTSIDIKINRLIAKVNVVDSINEEKAAFQSPKKTQGFFLTDHENNMLLSSSNKRSISLSPKQKENYNSYRHSRQYHPPSPSKINSCSKTLFKLTKSLSKNSMKNILSISKTKAKRHSESDFLDLLVQQNPIYHLLYSPLSSLKPSEKEQLIENLLIFLKQALSTIEKLQFVEQNLSEKMQQNEKLTLINEKLEEKCEQHEKEIQIIQQRLTTCDEEIESLKVQLEYKCQENHRIKQQVQKLDVARKERNKKEDFYEQSIQTIRLHQNQRIKAKYFKILLCRITNIRRFRLHLENTEKILTNFIELRAYRSIQQYSVLNCRFRILKNKVLKGCFNRFANNSLNHFFIDTQLQQKISKVQKRFFKLRFREFVRNIQIGKLSHKYKKQIQSFSQKRQKTKIFKAFQLNVEQQQDRKKEEKAQKFQENIVRSKMSKMMMEWLIWAKSLKLREEEVQIKHELNLIRNFYSKLTDFSTASASFNDKSHQLWIKRKAQMKQNNFRLFCLLTQADIQTWKSRQFKIASMIKRNYLFNFIKTTQDLVVKKRIQHNQKKKMARRLMLNQLSEIRVKKLLRIGKVKRKIRNFYMESVLQKVLVSKRQFDLEKSCGIATKKQVFILMRTKSKKQKESHLKFQFVKTMLNHNICRTQRQFFYKLRISYLERRLKDLRLKLADIGPDIELIEKRQIETNLQKAQLRQQLDQRLIQIQQYRHEVRELHILLDAKTVKYEKLQNIYSESIYNHDDDFEANPINNLIGVAEPQTFELTYHSRDYSRENPFSWNNHQQQIQYEKESTQKLKSNVQNYEPRIRGSYWLQQKTHRLNQAEKDIKNSLEKFKADQIERQNSSKKQIFTPKGKNSGLLELTKRKMQQSSDYSHFKAF